MGKYYELIPAIGRDYKSAKDAKQAFLGGKDWIGDYSLNFRYCSVQDFEPGDTVLLRYKRHTMVVDVKVPKVVAA